MFPRMSDMSQGEGWWLASDDKSYPPQPTHPQAPEPGKPASWRIVTMALAVAIMAASCVGASVSVEDDTTTAATEPAATEPAATRSETAFAGANGIATESPATDAKAEMQEDPFHSGGQASEPMPSPFTREQGQHLFRGLAAPATGEDIVALVDEVDVLRRLALNLVDVDAQIAWWEESLFNEESMRDLQSQLVEAVEDGLMTVEEYEGAQRTLEYNFEEQYRPLTEMRDAMYEELAPGIEWINNVFREAGLDSEELGYEEFGSLPLSICRYCLRGH